MKIKFKLVEILFLFLIFLSFFYRGINFLDPDFGWRLKAGEMFITQGIPKTDPFSYTMPSFHWVDHAWMTSVLIYFVYTNFGRYALSLIFSIAALSSVFIIYSAVAEKERFNLPIHISQKLKVDLGIFNNIFIWLTVYIIYNFFGIRAQVFSWLLFSVLLKILLCNNRAKFIIPILMLLWTNLHGSFVVGLFLIAFMFLFELVEKIIKKRKVLFPVSHFSILFFSFIASFINPYGKSLWREAFSSLLDNKLRGRIVEWMPSLTMINLVMIMLVSLSLVFVVSQRKTIYKSLLLLYFFFLFEAFLSRRHLPIWALLCLPIATTALTIFFRGVKKIIKGKERFIVFYRYVFIFFLFITIIQSVYDFVKISSFREDLYYPKSALSYLQKNQISNNLFSEYGWGGYLIWKYPQKKTAIDGRMPSWRRKEYPENEEGDMMESYFQILKEEKDLLEFCDRYRIDTVLWPSGKQNGDKKELSFVMNKMIQLLFPYQKLINPIEILQEKGWSVVYDDGVGVVIRR